MTVEVDRSRIVAYQRCPRERYWGYHHLGKGLQRKAKALPLQFGSAFHEGTPELLLGRGIESAVLKSQLYLSNEFAKFAIDFGEESADQAAQREYSIGEQGAMAEALLRAWWAWEGEQFLDTFDVLEVEQEGRAALSTRTLSGYNGDGSLQEADVDDVVLMFRPDAVVREKLTGDIYVISWKTAATFNKRTVAQCRHDMQSMSEVFGVNARGDQKVEGVLYKFAIKGLRSKDDWDGLWKQNSHLIYGWKRVGPGEGDDDWAWTFKWTTEELNEKTGKMKGTTLGKGWKKVPIWRDYPGGVKQWIEDLAANQIAPRHISALDQVFPQAMPVDRRADEVEKWRRQTVNQELKVAKNADLMNSYAYSDVTLQPELDDLFPQYSHSCEAYSGCSFRDICWDGIPPEPGELYQIRESNHPEIEGGEDEAGC